MTWQLKLALWLHNRRVEALLRKRRRDRQAKVLPWNRR